jgi:hypothetical protein
VMNSRRLISPPCRPALHGMVGEPSAECAVLPAYNRAIGQSLGEI